jgi:predicted aldo/keto reductase-like oxidoreductase
MRDPELVMAAIDSGINYLDTADMYMNGMNEQVIGQVMETRRNDVFLTTKIEPVTTIVQSRRDIENSLRRLRTDHVDLLLFHHGGETVDLVLNEDHMAVLDEARRKGQARFVGYSAHTYDPRVYEATVACGFYEVVTVCYNYFSPPGMTASIELLRRAGIGVVTMKNMLNFATQPRVMFDDIRKEKDGPVTYAQALIGWVLSNRYVDLAIPGITAFEHLAENMAIVGKNMTAEAHDVLRRFGGTVAGTHCLGLSGCTGCEEQCPNGVSIRELNRCLGYAYGYGDLRLARENYRRLPSGGGLSACADCQECTVTCVNGLDLAGNILRARELFA